MKKIRNNDNYIKLLLFMSQSACKELKTKTEFIDVTESEILDEDSLSDEELKSINNIELVTELQNDPELHKKEDYTDIENIIDGFTVYELNNLQLMLDKRRSRMCGPLSWKKERDKDIKPVPLVKSIRENRWEHGLEQLKIAGRNRYEDLIVETQYNFNSHEPNDTVVSGLWVFAILSLYDKDTNEKDYVKVTAYIDDDDVLYKIYKGVYGFNVTEYLLRARHTWKSQSKFINRESAIV